MRARPAQIVASTAKSLFKSRKHGRALAAQWDGDLQGAAELLVGMPSSSDEQSMPELAAAMAMAAAVLALVVLLATAAALVVTRASRRWRASSSEA